MVKHAEINNAIKHNIRILLYIFTIAAIVFFLYIKRREIYYLCQLNYGTLLLLITAAILPVSLNALLFKNNISFFSLRLSFKEWYGLAVTNTMYNYLLPARGGIALRAFYLKRVHKFPYSRYLSFTLGIYILNLLFAATLASLICLLLAYNNSLNKPVYLYLSLTLLTALIALIFFLCRFDPKHIPQTTRVFNFLKNTADGFKQFRSKPFLIRNLFLIQFFFIASITLRLFIAFYALDIPVSFIKLLLVNSLADFTMVFSFTPGNLGVREGIIGVSAGLLNITADQALLAAILDRFANIVVVFILGLIFSRILFHKIEQ